MQTPVFNKKQLKTTLSAKKTKTKTTIKNVLASPYITNFWPVVTPEDEKTLKSALESYLPRIKIIEKVPASEIKKIPKSERKVYREKFYKDKGLSIDKSESDGIILGINGVTKTLEEHVATAVLIDSDVKPRFMVQHIIDQSVLFNVPVLLMPALKEITRKHCGFPALTLALKVNLKPETKLYLLQQTIISVSEKYPPPGDHFNFERSKNLFDDSVLTISDDESNEISEISEKHLGIEESKETEQQMIKRLYLVRRSTESRVFVPQSTSKSSSAPPYDFLPLSDSINARKNSKNSANYKALKVKVLTGDPERNTKKIEKLKQMRKQRKRKQGYTHRKQLGNRV